MEDLVFFYEKRIIVGENIDYIQILRKHKRNDEKQLKKIEDGDFVLWLLKDPKFKEGNSFFHGLAHFK
jgi:hypothetical protein